MSLSIDLSDRTALVTGGTRGIGFACVEVLANAGADVVFTGRKDSAQSQDRADQISQEFGVKCAYRACDSTDQGATADLTKFIHQEFARLDVLVNNAGIMNGSLLGMITPLLIQETLDTNVSGVINHTQSALKLMRRTGGSIINVSSILGTNGFAGQVTYSASKAAVIGITKSAAKETAQLGIRVNAVAPGFIDTELVSDFSDDQRDELVKAIGLARFGSAEDVANLVLFLASDLSSYLTGQVIGIDGGMVA